MDTGRVILVCAPIYLACMYLRPGGAPQVCSSRLPGGPSATQNPGIASRSAPGVASEGMAASAAVGSRQRASVVLAPGHWPLRQEHTHTAAPRFPSLPLPWRGVPANKTRPGHQAWGLLGGSVPAVLEIQVALVSAAAETSRRAARPRKRPIPERPVTGSRGLP